MSKQSSVEWFLNEFSKQIEFVPNSELDLWYKELIPKAKAMHRKEIEEAYVYGAAYQIDIKNGLSPIFYYNERFGGQDNE